jgi:hypothetical protein
LGKKLHKEGEGMFYLHAVPGRLKIKGEEFKKRANLKEKLRSELSVFDGIKDIEHNPNTGSIIIWYDQKALSATTILEHLERAGFLNQKNLLSHEDYLIHTSLNFGKRIGKMLADSLAEPLLGGSSLVFLFKLI